MGPGVGGRGCERVGWDGSWGAWALERWVAVVSSPLSPHRVLCTYEVNVDIELMDQGSVKKWCALHCFENEKRGTIEEAKRLPVEIFVFLLYTFFTRPKDQIQTKKSHF